MIIHAKFFFVVEFSFSFLVSGCIGEGFGEGGRDLE